jgi:molybdopterin-guanine dinucleotide biosynthesis protein A
VAVIGRTEEQLPEALRIKIRAVPDDQPGLGPLGGLNTAFNNFPEAEAILLCACDLPLVTDEAFKWLVACSVELFGGATSTRETHGIIPVRNNQPEPLFAVYYRNSSLLVRHQLDAGDRSMRGLISAGTFRHIVLPGGLYNAAMDIDTPADLRRLNIKRDIEI